MASRSLRWLMAAMLSFVSSDRETDGLGGVQVEISKHKNLRATKFKVFQINLSWECMSLPPFGSGQHAAVHCKPGEFINAAEAGGMPQWQPTDIALPVKKPEPELVTSCTNTFLHKMKAWNVAESYDVITMVEMANAGIAGFKHLERLPDTLPQLAKTTQQVDPQIYGTLVNAVLPKHKVFAHVVATRSVATQATFYNPETLGELTLGLGFNMVAKEGRPVSALFFEVQKVLVLNVHSVHFRKALIGMDEAFFGTIGSDDARKEYGKKEGEGVSVSDIAKTINNDFEGGTDKADIDHFPTDQLQTLFGKWIDAKLIEELERCGEKQDAFQFHEDIQGYCQVGDKTFMERWKGETWSEWKIFASGDFNDETMELSTFPIFGVDISVKPEERKRTCCSDRDADFKEAFSGEPSVDDEERYSSGILVHTKANTQYITGGCKYLPTEEIFDTWMTTDPTGRDPMTLPGAPKVLGDGTPGQSLSPWSLSPWPSDIILSNVAGGPLEFPPYYAQRMSTCSKATDDEGKNKYKCDPVMPGVTEPGKKYDNGMISDHDPIQRTFTIEP